MNVDAAKADHRESTSALTCAAMATGFLAVRESWEPTTFLLST